MSEENGLSQRSEDASWAALVVGFSGASAITARMAEQLSPVFACMDVISSALASLPSRIYRRQGASREMAEDHPILDLIDTPNH